MFGFVQICSDMFGCVRICSVLVRFSRFSAEQDFCTDICSDLFGTLKFRLHFVQICSVLFGFVRHLPPNRSCSVLFRSEQNRTYDMLHIRTNPIVSKHIRTRFCSDFFGSPEQKNVRICSVLTEIVKKSDRRSEQIQTFFCSGEPNKSEQI